MSQITLSGCDTIQTYWIKRDGSAWKLYTNAACTNVVTNHTFVSPYNEVTGYHFIVTEANCAFDANKPIVWRSSNVPNMPTGSKHSTDYKEYAFKDTNNYSHSTDKSCPFDLQVVDENSALIPIFRPVEDVDPTILEKGDPEPDMPPTE